MKILYVVRDMSFIEPLGIMFLSAIGKSEGHESQLAIINEESVLAKIGRERPDMVCMSVMSVDANAFESLARSIKDEFPETFVVVGGPHVTFEREQVRRWPVDVAVQGEGDVAFRKLVRAVDAGEPFDHIENINTSTVVNPMGKLPDPLDDQPHPDRELVYFSGGHLANLNVKSFMSSRGCAYRCTYCFNSKLNEMNRGKGAPVRRFSVEYMLEEIERVKQDYGLSFVRFGDDVFAYIVDDWLLEFAEKFPQRIGAPFYCLIRPDLLKPPLVSVLRRAGCHSICMSIEAGSERLRREILMRQMEDKVILDAFDNVHSAGIQVYANAMFGLPGTSIEDDIESVELAAKCKPAYPSFTILTPFRGTTLGEQCAREGLIDTGYPEHTTDRSMLNCFSEKQKDAQVNLVHLGIFAVKFPFLKRLILKRMIYWKPNPVFFFAWYLMKNYVSAKYIWPIQASVFAKARLAFRALTFELSGRLRFGLLSKRRREPRVESDQKSVFTRPSPVFEDKAMLS